MTTVRFLLGDQLTPRFLDRPGADQSRDVVLMAEVADEALYVRHHKKKLAFVFAAMRRFASELRSAGWRVDYVRLDEPANSGSLTGELARAAARHKAVSIACVEASEHRVLAMQQNWAGELQLPVTLYADDRFLCDKTDFAAWANGRKTLRLEHFYREMRRRHGLLMDGDAPVGGAWNFDKENRKRAEPDLFMPKPPRFSKGPEAQEAIDLVKRRFGDHFGDIEPFWFATSRSQARAAADDFMRERLPRFGDYQDAMLRGEKFLYHSVLSPLINVGLLDPLDLCRRAEAEYRAGRAPLNAVEGFIRQIAGWREFVRGVYWLMGPDYVQANALGAKRPLPKFYWTGDTSMACLSAAIRQTKEEAYAHHIQRLMVTGNFALLAGVDPHDVHAWYLSVYMDAFEWVEAPNTIGMSQFADGGVVGSKPYAASGAYINRMSDHCGACRFDVEKRVGDDACPFNALYWDFLARHRPRFENNPRMAQMYRTFDRMTPEMQVAVRTRAARILADLDQYSAAGATR